MEKVKYQNVGLDPDTFGLLTRLSDAAGLGKGPYLRVVLLHENDRLKPDDLDHDNPIVTVRGGRPMRLKDLTKPEQLITQAAEFAGISLNTHARETLDQIIGKLRHIRDGLPQQLPLVK